MRLECTATHHQRGCQRWLLDVALNWNALFMLKFCVFTLLRSIPLIFSKLRTMSFLLGMGLILGQTFNAQAATTSFKTNFAPFLPAKFEPNDTFDLSFSGSNAQRAHPIRRIRYTIIIIIESKIVVIPIRFYFSELSKISKSNSILPTFDPSGAPVLPESVDLTLAGINSFAITNDFTPYNYGIFDSSNFISADLTFDVLTDGLLPGDKFTASLNQNGVSIGSQSYVSIPLKPEPPIDELLPVEELLTGDEIFASLSQRVGEFGPQSDFSTADFSQTPVPGPLPLLGALTALGWSRRLRKRITSHQL